MMFTPVDYDFASGKTLSDFGDGETNQLFILDHQASILCNSAHRCAA